MLDLWKGSDRLAYFEPAHPGEGYIQEHEGRRIPHDRQQTFGTIGGFDDGKTQAFKERPQSKTEAPVIIDNENGIS
jgi:hypothetical protein